MGDYFGVRENEDAYGKAFKQKKQFMEKGFCMEGTWHMHGKSFWQGEKQLMEKGFGIEEAGHMHGRAWKQKRGNHLWNGI